MRVEDVDVIEPHSPQALVEARQHVFARPAALSVGPGPHIPAGLRRNDELVPVGPEIVAEEAAEIELGAAERGAVVVGEIEMGDAEIERGAKKGALNAEGRGVSEVVPEAEREEGQLQAGLAAGAGGQ